MEYALSKDKIRAKANREQRAFCPGCGRDVIAKCGDIYVKHWAHVVGSDCDTWYEPETEWHRRWKDRFKEGCREVVMGPHRADIVATHKIKCLPFVIELQHSPIDPAEIQEREEFYGRNMIWILDGAGFKDNFKIDQEVVSENGTKVTATFRWKWQRKSWRFRSRPLYIDFGDCLWQVLDCDSQGRGKARCLTMHQFLAGFSEAIGKDLPVKWRFTGTGRPMYVFGLGHVLIYPDTESRFYRLVVHHKRQDKPDYRPYKFTTIEDAKQYCERRMHILLKQSGKFVPKGQAVDPRAVRVSNA